MYQVSLHKYIFPHHIAAPISTLRGVWRVCHRPRSTQRMSKDAGFGRGLKRLRPGADQAFFQLHLITFAILSSCGFHGSSANACNILAELVQRYLALLARTTTTMANDAGRSCANVWDAVMALEDIMGQGALEELIEWANDEGVWKRTTTDLWPPAVRKEQIGLSRLTQSCKNPAYTSFVYERIEDDATRSELAIREAVNRSMEEDLVWGMGSYVPESSYSQNNMLLEIPTDTDSYIPPFLPSLPTKAAWEEQFESEPRAPTPAPALKTETTTRPMPAAAAVQGVPSSDEMSEDGVRKVWRRRAMAYAGVLAEGSGTRSELPSIEACAKRRGQGAKIFARGDSTSSIDAFMQIGRAHV